MSKNIICSPYSQVNKYTNYSCYTYENLIELKELWNERHPYDMIIEEDFDKIYNNLKEKTKYMCKNELCWLKTIANNDEDIFNETFAPLQPTVWKEDNDHWLTNIDIMNVMKQYEKLYKTFEFIGPTPIDYDAFSKRKNDWVWSELKNFDLNKYINSYISDLGIVFNLDKHTKPGSHWVALYVNLIDNKIYYFDSNGLSVPNKIYQLCETIKAQGLKQIPSRKFTLSSNYDNEHQMKDGECGIYVMYFLINMISKSLPWNVFKKGKINDKLMNEFRSKYFNKN